MNGIGAVSTVRDLALLLSVVLGGFLCWSAYHKLVRPRAFIVAASAYRPLSPRASQWVGLAVPMCEFTLGAALILGVAVRVAALTSGLLFALFAVAMGYNLARGNIIPCGCSGPTRTRTIGIVPIAEDAALVALAAGLAVAAGTWDVVPSWSPFAHDLVQPDPRRVYRLGHQDRAHRGGSGSGWCCCAKRLWNHTCRGRREPMSDLYGSAVLRHGRKLLPWRRRTM